MLLKGIAEAAYGEKTETRATRHDALITAMQRAAKDLPRPRTGSAPRRRAVAG